MLTRRSKRRLSPFLSGPLGVLLSVQTWLAACARPAPRPPAATRHWRSSILVTCQLMLVLDATVMNVALPRIRADLGFSATGLSWVMNAYTLVFGGLLLLGGRAGDMFGRRRLFMVGIALFTRRVAGRRAGGPSRRLADRRPGRAGRRRGGGRAEHDRADHHHVHRAAATDPRAGVCSPRMASAGFAIGLIVGGLLTEARRRGGRCCSSTCRSASPPWCSRPAARQRAGSGTRAGSTCAGALTATRGRGRAGVRRSSAPPTTAGATRGDLRTLGGRRRAAGGVRARSRRGRRQPMLPLRLFADRNRAAGVRQLLPRPGGR